MRNEADCPLAIINNDWAPTLAFAVSLGRRNVGLDFYGPGVGRWSRYCRRHRPCPPPEQADRFLPWLQDRLRSGEIQRVAPTTDLLAYYLAVLREEFPADVQRAITPLPEIMRCLIKTQFAMACTDVGQLVPATATPDDPDAAIFAARAMGYPLIVKPKSHLVVGTARRGRLVHNEAELRRAYQRYAVVPGQSLIAEQLPELLWPLLQMYIPSARRSVYSVSGIKDATGGILAALLTCKREQWPPDTGVSTSQIVCTDERILQAGLRTVDQLLSCGIFELELLNDGDKLLAIDLNPRAFGFVALDIAMGNDLPWLWWQSSFGEVQPVANNAPRAPLECRFVVPYYFAHTIRRVFGPHFRATGRSETGRRPQWISMVGHRSDPLPMLLAQLRMLKLMPHPRGLVRPYLAEAWGARAARAGREPAHDPDQSPEKPRGTNGPIVALQSVGHSYWDTIAASPHGMPETLKIAYFINQYPKVSHSFIRREILELEQQGFQVQRISLRGWDDPLPDPGDQQERDRTRYVLKHGVLPLLLPTIVALVKSPVRFCRALRLALQMGWETTDRPLPYHLIYFAEACQILPWMLKFGADRLHAHFGSNSAEVAMLAHVLGGPPFSFTVHGPGDFEMPMGFAEKIHRANFVVAISAFGRSQLYMRSRYADWPKIKVVRCGLEPDFYDIAPAPMSTVPRLVCVGRLCEAKGQLLLIEAVARLARQGIDFELVLAGDGEMRAVLEAAIAQHGISKQVRITGWISSDEVRSEILAARALVLASFAEGLPVVLMEAMALRRPVLTTYIAGIPELVQPGKHGWLFPSGSVDELEAALKDCLSSSSEKLQIIGDAGRLRVLEFHSIDAEVGKLAELFRAPAQA